MLLRTTALVAALALGACTVIPNTPSSGIRAVGQGLFTVSEMSGFGNVVERAGAFCGSFGQRVRVEGDSTQKGLMSGDDYAMLIFSCENV